MGKELAKTYDPKGLEDRLYQKWMDGGYFHAKVNPDKKPFTIVMPPPNVTGQLHMGHALDNTMQDILIRYKRMQGYEALWQPGTDHAAIATEVRVTNELKEKGIDKEEIGREKFLEYCWQWKEEYGSRIIDQLHRLGSSADWERERPSIAKPQQSVNLQTRQIQELTVSGRHDPCIVPRAVPVMEAVTALALYDLI